MEHENTILSKISQINIASFEKLKILISEHNKVELVGNKNTDTWRWGRQSEGLDKGEREVGDKK